MFSTPEDTSQVERFRESDNECDFELEEERKSLFPGSQTTELQYDNISQNTVEYVEEGASQLDRNEDYQSKYEGLLSEQKALTEYVSVVEQKYSKVLEKYSEVKKRETTLTEQHENCAIEKESLKRRNNELQEKVNSLIEKISNLSSNVKTPILPTTNNIGCSTPSDDDKIGKIEESLEQNESLEDKDQETSMEVDLQNKSETKVEELVIVNTFTSNFQEDEACIRERIINEISLKRATQFQNLMQLYESPSFVISANKACDEKINEFKYKIESFERFVNAMVNAFATKLHNLQIEISNLKAENERLSTSISSFSFLALDEDAINMIPPLQKLKIDLEQQITENNDLAQNLTLQKGVVEMQCKSLQSLLDMSNTENEVRKSLESSLINLRDELKSLNDIQALHLRQLGEANDEIKKLYDQIRDLKSEKSDIQVKYKQKLKGIKEKLKSLEKNISKVNEQHLGDQQLHEKKLSPIVKKPKFDELDDSSDQSEPNVNFSVVFDDNCINSFYDYDANSNSLPNFDDEDGDDKHVHKEIKPTLMSSSISAGSIQKSRSLNTASKKVILFSGFNVKDKVYSMKLKDKLAAELKVKFKCSISEVLTPSVTHVISPPNCRTVKTLGACLMSIWIVTPNWVSSSLLAGKFLPEIDYGSKFTDQPFMNKIFYLSQQFKRDIKRIEIFYQIVVSSGGGIVKDDHTQADYVIVSSTEDTECYKQKCCLTWVEVLDLIPYAAPSPPSGNSPQPSKTKHETASNTIAYPAKIQTPVTPAKATHFTSKKPFSITGSTQYHPNGNYNQMFYRQTDKKGEGFKAKLQNYVNSVNASHS